jgi:5-formyltetrahydrofolate cyclo-ligase
VPGVAFTPDGRRLGHGRGYYDRLLPQLTRAYRLGLCFPFQLLDDLPTDENDVKMEEVIAGTSTTNSTNSSPTPSEAAPQRALPQMGREKYVLLHR